MRISSLLSFFVITTIGLGCALSESATSEHAAAADLPVRPSIDREWRPSAAYHWLDIVLEASARDVERIGAQPTILSRQMAIPMTAMFDAWACYDDRAVGTRLGGSLRRPPSERTAANREEAIAYACYRTAMSQFPHFTDYLTDEMQKRGLDPDEDTRDTSNPAGIGNRVAAALLEYRRHDGANQFGDEEGSDGTPYSDYTHYSPVNTVDEIVDPDRWQPIPFDDGEGGTIVLDFLTPQWHLVTPFALESADQFRPGPPPLVGSAQLKREVDECIELNASLTPEEKALVEFMRDGPRSTGQSGHWLKFAQAVSRRDRNDLERDVKLFFTVANCALDTFIAAWDSKRHYDSSRPWTLVRHLYRGEQVAGWAGPGQGAKSSLPAEEWHPYSPATFITPPFPGYVSGHSCVSGGCAKILELFTGSDTFGIEEARHAGDLTEKGFSCATMQRLDGRSLAELLDEHASCDVVLPMPTFHETADMAGQSRVLGGYHIQADNVAGLQLGRDVAESIWPKIRSYFDGTEVAR